MGSNKDLKKNRYQKSYMLVLCENKKIYYHINNIKIRSNNEFKEIDIKTLTCYYVVVESI